MQLQQVVMTILALQPQSSWQHWAVDAISHRICSALEKLGNHTVTIWTDAKMLIGACWLTQVLTNKWKLGQLGREIAAARTWWLDTGLQIPVGNALVQQLEWHKLSGRAVSAA